jgi:PTH2 family peptidyl-tRNA hydrolase
MKLVIVMRKDLNMRKGKMVAQGAHAATMPFVMSGTESVEARLVQWVKRDAMVKICVGCETGEELESIQQKAIAARLAVYAVIDAGRTEFHGEPTKTCIAIGPDEDEKIDAVTGSLSLL